MIRISLIIATYNRAEALVEALHSVRQQSLPNEEWECVVVNNNSTDDTTLRVEAFKEEYPRLQLRLVEEPQQGLSHARNAGIRATQGAYIAIIDDDERIHADFLKSYVELFDSHPEALAAGGPVVACYEECPRPRWMSRFTEEPIANPMDFGPRVRPFPRGRIPAGGNMAFRREVFERFGLFDPNLGRVGDRLIGGEESDLFARLHKAGFRPLYTPRAVMWHLIPARKLTDDYFDRLCYNIGVSQRARALAAGRLSAQRLSEALKWVATLLIAAFYLIMLRPARARYLLRLRRGISRGLFEKSEGVRD